MKQKNNLRVYSTNSIKNSLRDQYQTKYSNLCKGLSRNAQASNPKSHAYITLYDTQKNSPARDLPSITSENLKTLDINTFLHNQKLPKMPQEFNLSSVISRSFFE